MIPIPSCGDWSVDVHASHDDLDMPAPAGGPLVAYARRSGGAWHIAHRDGRAVTVATAVEVLERLLMISDRDGPVETVLLVAPHLP